MPQLQTPVSEKDRTVGPADAPATLVEYGDYQCPTCGEAEPILQEVRRAMGDRLRFAFRDFPLTDIHSHALDAAVAAGFAAKHGQFWPMHDALLAHQRRLSRPDLEGYAQTLGLDGAALRKEFDDPTVAEAVMEEFRDGEASGVRGTPTLFVNGARYDGEFDASSIIAALGG